MPCRAVLPLNFFLFGLAVLFGSLLDFGTALAPFLSI